MLSTKVFYENIWFWSIMSMKITDFKERGCFFHAVAFKIFIRLNGYTFFLCYRLNEDKKMQLCRWHEIILFFIDLWVVVIPFFIFFGCSNIFSQMLFNISIQGQYWYCVAWKTGFLQINVYAYIFVFKLFESKSYFFSEWFCRNF